MSWKALLLLWLLSPGVRCNDPELLTQPDKLFLDMFAQHGETLVIAAVQWHACSRNPVLTAHW